MNELKTDVRLLIEASTDEQIGQRMRAVVDAVVSVYLCMYVCGLMTLEAVESIARWYSIKDVSNAAAEGIEQPIVIEPVAAPVKQLVELTQIAEPIQLIKPFKRPKPQGFSYE